MSKTVNIKILLRNDTSANWVANNPVLSKGEMGIQIDNKKFKFGDGITPWNELDYGAGNEIPNASNLIDGLMSKQDYAKLSGIEAGAEANVESDWAAVDGDAAILHKPTTLAGYGITDAMTAQAITQAITQAVNNAVNTVFSYKGTKQNIQSLPVENNKVGDVWHVTSSAGEYVWNGTSWEQLGSTIDLTGYLQQVSIAGIALTPNSYTITVDQLKTQLGLGAAAYKNIDTTVNDNTSSQNLPTTQAIKEYIQNKIPVIEGSENNGYLSVNSDDILVYELPNTVLESTDILLLDCGNSLTEYN